MLPKLMTDPLIQLGTLTNLLATVVAISTSWEHFEVDLEIFGRGKGDRGGDGAGRFRGVVLALEPAENGSLNERVMHFGEHPGEHAGEPLGVMGKAGVLGGAIGSRARWGPASESGTPVMLIEKAEATGLNSANERAA